MILKNQTMIYKNQTMILSFIAYPAAFGQHTGQEGFTPYIKIESNERQTGMWWLSGERAVRRKKHNSCENSRKFFKFGLR